MKIEIAGKENVDLYEFRKAISFISEDIESYTISSSQIVLEINDKANCEEIKRRTKDLLDKYVINNKSSKYFDIRMMNRCQLRHSIYMGHHLHIHFRFQ